MPGIGRPTDFAQANPYAGIKKAPAANGNSKVDATILQQVTGQQPESNVKIVDRNAHNKMGKDEFLKLLSHQLQHQDPMNPMDQNKFSAELAQFAQLEQLTSMNGKFEKMNANSATESKFYAASFLGKKVYTSGTTIDFKGKPMDVGFNLEQPASKVQVRLFDKTGNMMAEVQGESMGRGAQTIQWDGKQLDGYPATNGEYRIEVKAWTEDNKEVAVKTQTSGLVKAVTFDNGETVMHLDDGKKVTLKDVSKFEDARAEGQFARRGSPESNNNLGAQQGAIQ